MLMLGGCGGAPPSTASSYDATVTPVQRYDAAPAVTPVQQSSKDYGRLSLRLNPGMSEKDVIGLLGEPKLSDLQTCGAATPHPWQCKIWKFGYPVKLGVIFGQNSTGAWVVNSWNNW
jgi:hypothetical protein